MIKNAILFFLVGMAIAAVYISMELNGNTVMADHDYSKHVAEYHLHDCESGRKL